MVQLKLNIMVYKKRKINENLILGGIKDILIKHVINSEITEETIENFF